MTACDGTTTTLSRLTTLTGYPVQGGQGGRTDPAVHKSPSLTVAESWLPTAISTIKFAVPRTIRIANSEGGDRVGRPDKLTDAPGRRGGQGHQVQRLAACGDADREIADRGLQQIRLTMMRGGSVGSVGQTGPLAPLTHMVGGECDRADHADRVVVEVVRVVRVDSPVGPARPCQR
jgi:hypothetical protein